MKKKEEVSPLHLYKLGVYKNICSFKALWMVFILCLVLIGIEILQNPQGGDWIMDNIFKFA